MSFALAVDVVPAAVVGVVAGAAVVVVVLTVVAGGARPMAGYFTTVVVVGEARLGWSNPVACPLLNRAMRPPVAASTPATVSTSHLAQ